MDSFLLQAAGSLTTPPFVVNVIMIGWMSELVGIDE
jgi:hypothetical protein